MTSDFAPRGNFDWEPGEDRLSGTAWVLVAGLWVAFVVFYDSDLDGYDFDDALRFVDDHARARFRRWLLDEVAWHFPIASTQPEDAP
jgi:hypothetical protein